MKLYTYWRSMAAFRVRAALNLKGLHAQLLPLDIIKGEQHSDEYRAVNPQLSVPTLIEDDGHRLVQSLAILEYLEERYPDPPLLPRDIRARAYVRGIALILAGDSHPFVTPRVRRYLQGELHVDAPAVTKWMLHWMSAGLQTFESELTRARYAAQCCYGDTPTFADLCLVPHVIALEQAPGFDFSPYPTALAIVEHCMSLDEFRCAAPQQQPDAPLQSKG